MKKLLASLLIACTSLVTFSGCSMDSLTDGFDTVKDKVGSVVDTVKDKIDSLLGKEPEEVIDVEAALDIVDNMYVDKIGKGRVDYEVTNSIMIGNTKYDVVWSVDVGENVVKLIRGEESTKVVVSKTLEEDTDYKLTATVTASNGETGSIYFNGTVAKMPSTFPELISDKPVEGQKYYLYVWQDKAKVDCYFNGNMASTYYFGSVAEYDNEDEPAAEVYVEYVAGSDTLFNIYFEKENEVTHETEKYYIGVQEAWNQKNSYWTFNVKMDTAPVSQFEYSAEHKTVVSNVPARSAEDNKNQNAEQTTTATVCFGANGTFTTISAYNVATLTEDDDVHVGGLAIMADATKVDDTDKVAFEKDVLSVETKYNGDQTVELPVNGDRYADVEISWTDNSDNVSIEGGVMTITAPTEATTFTLTANFKLNNVTDTKTFEVTIAPALNIPEAGSTITIAQALAIGTDMEQDVYTEGKYYVTGVIQSEKFNSTYGNMTIKDANGDTLYVYGTYDAEGLNKYGDITGDKPVVGDTVTLYGAVGNHYGPQMKNAWITSFTHNTTPPPSTDVSTSPIATILAGEAGTYQAEGTVVAVYARGFLLKDSTGMILVYNNTSFDASFIGTKVTVKGATTSYGGFMQFGEGTTHTTNGTETVTQPTPVALDGAAVDAYLTNNVMQYATVTGTLNISGYYYNLTVEGATVVGSIAYPNEAQATTLAALNGKKITVTGYTIGVSGSSTKYLNFMMDTAVAVSGGTEHQHNYVDGKCECGADDPNYTPDVEVVEGLYNLTVVSLKVGAYVYDKNTVATVNGVEFTYIQIGNYDGNPYFQMRTKYEVSASIWNSTAFSTNITKIVLVPNQSKTGDYQNDYTLTLGNTADCNEKTMAIKTDGKKTVTIEIEGNYTYFKLTHANSNTQYFDAIEIHCATEAHEHVYAESVTKPTCTEDGYTTFTCTCGHTYTGNTVAATGHDYDEAVTEPTCTEGGFTTYTCACGHSYVGNEVAATGHDYDEVVTKPTCLAGGYTTYTCACGHSYTGNETAATGHVYENGVCVGCGKEEPNPELPHEHEYAESVTKPTCTEDGYTTFTCECGHTYTGNTVTAPGHDYDAVVTEPTCTEDGFTTYTCACGDTYVDDEVAAPGHDYDAVVTEPTCTEDGYTTYTCACGDSYVDDEVAATGHADTNADYKCDECSTVMEPAADSTLTIPQAKALAKALGQSVYSTNSYYMTFTVKEVTNPTYGNMDVVDDDGNEYQIYGLYKDSVTDANRYDKFEYKPVKGDEITVYGAVGSHYSTPQMKNALLDECIAHTHNYVAVVTDPTCTAEGYTTHTCSICGDNYKDTTVAALGHTTENGTCERCEQEVGENAPQTTQAWVLVTDISQLTVGAQVIIAAPEADYAIGDYQKSGNRAGTAITKNGTQATFEDYVEANGYTNNGVEVFTVEAGTKANTFAFKVDTTDTTSNGYIYAASSSSNNLKTSTTKNDNSSWAITIDATTGEASVIAQGSYTRNIMRYNPNNGSPLFACYGNTNTGTGVCFYVLTTITL